MIKYENECVGCPTELGCLGSICQNRNIPHYYCDECGCEEVPSKLYKYDGEELCLDCLSERFETVG